MSKKTPDFQSLASKYGVAGKAKSPDLDSDSEIDLEADMGTDKDEDFGTSDDDYSLSLSIKKQKSGDKNAAKVTISPVPTTNKKPSAA